MKKMKLVLLLPTAVLLLAFGMIVADEPIQLIVNPHAMGVDPNSPICPQTHDPYAELAGGGWEYNEFMTLSKCGNKNSDSGAMFKNGPTAYSGQGQPGQYAVMWQDYDMTALGFDGSDISYTFQVEMVSVRADDWQATLYSSTDGILWGSPVILHNFPEDGSCGNGSKFPMYCGSATLPYAPYIRIELKSLWSASNSLGQKWANVSLFADDGVFGGTPTPTQFPATIQFTPTPSAEPTMTPTGMGRWCTDNPNWPGC